MSDVRCRMSDVGSRKSERVSGRRGSLLSETVAEHALVTLLPQPHPPHRIAADSEKRSIGTHPSRSSQPALSFCRTSGSKPLPKPDRATHRASQSAQVCARIQSSTTSAPARADCICVQGSSSSGPSVSACSSHGATLAMPAVPLFHFLALTASSGCTARTWIVRTRHSLLSACASDGNADGKGEVEGFAGRMLSPRPRNQTQENTTRPTSWTWCLPRLQKRRHRTWEILPRKVPTKFKRRKKQGFRPQVPLGKRLSPSLVIFGYEVENQGIRDCPPQPV